MNGRGGWAGHLEQEAEGRGPPFHRCQSPHSSLGAKSESLRLFCVSSNNCEAERGQLKFRTGNLTKVTRKVRC